MSLPRLCLAMVCALLKNIKVFSLFTGFSSGVIRGYWMSTFLRLREDGRLVGQFLDVTGTSEGLRLGVRLPRRYKYYNNTILPLPRSQETAIDADFCLTWSTDPRQETFLKSSILSISLSHFLTVNLQDKTYSSRISPSSRSGLLRSLQSFGVTFFIIVVFIFLSNRSPAPS